MFIVHYRENEACTCRESESEGSAETLSEHPRTSVGWSSSVLCVPALLWIGGGKI